MKKAVWLVIFCMAFLVLWAGGAWAAQICVDPGGGGDYTDLQAALSAAESNGEDDIIKVVQGTYYRNFVYESSEGQSIALEGGYTSGCAAQVVNPANTVLDGNHSGGRVLSLSNYNGGDIRVDGFSIQNGSSTGVGGGGVAEYFPQESGECGLTFEGVFC